MKQLLTLLCAALAWCATHAQSCIDRYLTDPLTYTDIVTSADQVNNPRDLDFKPHTNELWVMNRGSSNGGSMVIVHNAGLPGQTDEYRKDTHSSHFMTQASAMAFSDNGEWGAVSEVQSTAGGNSTFMGPAIWLGDLNIFATVFQNDWVSGLPLGSHIDMLHQSPYAMGIAADSAKTYWVMDGHNGNICRYDFVQDHGPGYDDHSAGRIWRYTDVPVTRVPDVPSHMVLDRENGWLYFIDGGAKQVKRLNVNTGSETGDLNVPSTANEPLDSYKRVEGAIVEVVDTWTTQPCGIDFAQGRLLVTDHDNGDIRIYDVNGTPTLMGTVTTGQPGIMGVKLGPDGRIWFVNNTTDKAVRIDPQPLADDAAITAIVSPLTVTATPKFYSTAYDVCASAIEPVVSLANMGGNDLTMVDIHFHMDGGAATMFSWTGTLAPGATVDVTLPSVVLATGAHQLNVWTEMPNGTADMNPLNDEMEGSFRTIDPVQPLPFTEDFSANTFPPDGWSYVHFNPNNKMTRATTSAFGNGSGSAKMDHYSGSMDITGQLDYLMLPRVDLSSAVPGTLFEFAVAYRQYNSSTNERQMLKASTDCGQTWSTLYDKQGAELSTGTPTTSAFTPNATQWRTESVDLSSVIGQSDVLFMFETESNFGNNIYIDDVHIGSVVGINEPAAVDFSMYPNPTNGHVDLAIRGGAGVVSIAVVDALGRAVRNWKPTAGSPGPIRLDLHGIPSGAYTVLCRSDKAQGSKTLVVTNEP